ncbi:NPAT isoform 3 [Pongo abelii]|uniref:NPAT isoform 3 n=1 Tax=Pongo abelii TaxID=9601 RepID=A0A2J8X2A5_PONAB|nr:NPAT isoform 3 [Pongo abelii]
MLLPSDVARLVLDRVSPCCPGSSAVVQSWFTAALTSWAQAILPPPPPEQLELQVHTTKPS